jgi:O-antigen/teichoic acid export membrane protein
VTASLGRSILRNTGALAGANVGRILVSFLVQLLVARGLGLEALGQYTLAMAYLNISQVLCEAGLPLWAVRTLAQAPHLRRAVWGRALLIQVSAALLLWPALVGISRLAAYPPATHAALWWVGASLPFFAITSATVTLFQAAERMELLLAVELSVNAAILAISAWAIAQGGNIADLLRIVVIAQVGGMGLALLLLLGARLLAGPQAAFPFTWRDLRQGVSPFFGLSLTDVLLQRLDILLLSLFADPRLLGSYSAAYNLVRVGIKLLQSVWRGVYPTLARLQMTTPALAAQWATRILVGGLWLCVGGAAVGMVTAAPLLRWIYGVDDAQATATLLWLVWQAPLFYLESYATTWLLVVGQARAALRVSLLHVGLLALLLPVGAFLGGAVGAAWGTLAAQAAGAAAGWVRVRAAGPRHNARG